MKKLGCLLLALAVGVSGILSGVTAQAAERNGESEKYVVVLDPGHGGAEVEQSRSTMERLTEKKRSTGRLRIIRCRHSVLLPNIEVHLTKKKKSDVRADRKE